GGAAVDRTGELFSAIEAGDPAAPAALLAASPGLAAARHAEGGSAPLFGLYRRRRDLLPPLLAAPPPPDLLEAAALDRTERVQELLAADPALARVRSTDGFTALHYLAFFGADLQIASLLLDHGAEVNAVAQNPMQVTPLHSAVAGRNDAL